MGDPRDPKLWRERFWAKVDKTENCWVWTGARCGSGRNYGKFKLPSRQALAHRVSWEMINGPIPHKLSIHHKCRNKLCVNPDHLECVTQAVNNIEALAYKADHAKCLKLSDFDALIRHVTKGAVNA